MAYRPEERLDQDLRSMATQRERLDHSRADTFGGPRRNLDPVKEPTPPVHPDPTVPLFPRTPAGQQAERQYQHLYNGAPDPRYQPGTVVSRFRPTYRALTESEKALHDRIKAKADELDHLYSQIDLSSGRTDGRYTAFAITALEQSVMWAVKALTS